MKSQTQKLAPDNSDAVLLILALISDFGFSDATRLFRAALPAAKRIAKLKARARRAGVPAIYINDNFGRWRSDFGEVMRLCSRSDERAATLLELIGPDKKDYCILKPKHSGRLAFDREGDQSDSFRNTRMSCAVASSCRWLFTVVSKSVKN